MPWSVVSSPCRDEKRDTGTGAVIHPGCCTGLEDRDEWRCLLDGDGDGKRLPWLGHDPWPRAEVRGELVVVTADQHRAGSDVVELPLAGLPALLAGAERDLAAFTDAACAWAVRHVPEHAERLGHVLRAALTAPPPTSSG